MKLRHHFDPWNEPIGEKIDWPRIILFAVLIVGGLIVWGFAIFGGIAALSGG